MNQFMTDVTVSEITKLRYNQVDLLKGIDNKTFRR